MAALMPRIPKVIAHRGASAFAPENTIAALEEAARRGARMAEVDVRLTADGEPVIFHDDELGRVTAGAGPLDSALFDEVRQLDAGARFAADFAGERIPTLDELIAASGSLGLDLNLEIKALAHRGRETARIALERAAEAWPADRAVPLVSSFRTDALAEARRAVPDWPRGLLLSRESEEGWREAVDELQAFSLHVDHRHQNAASIAVFRSSGLPVLCWTVNDRARAEDLLSWGAAAVISDIPDLLDG